MGGDVEGRRKSGGRTVGLRKGWDWSNPEGKAGEIGEGEGEANGEEGDKEREEWEGKDKDEEREEGKGEEEEREEGEDWLPVRSEVLPAF